MVNFWGDLIKSLREQRKLSQRQVAQGAKVNRSTLRRIEEGATEGSIDVVERVLAYLGYELDAMTTVSLQERRKQLAAEASGPVRRSRMSAEWLLAVRPDDLR